MGLLDGKNVLVTGISTDDSLAFATADMAMREGASVVLTSHGRVMSLCQRVARKLPAETVRRHVKRLVENPLGMLA